MIKVMLTSYRASPSPGASSSTGPSTTTPPPEVTTLAATRRPGNQNGPPCAGTPESFLLSLSQRRPLPVVQRSAANRVGMPPIPVVTPRTSDLALYPSIPPSITRGGVQTHDDYEGQPTDDRQRCAAPVAPGGPPFQGQRIRGSQASRRRRRPGQRGAADRRPCAGGVPKRGQRDGPPQGPGLAPRGRPGPGH